MIKQNIATLAYLFACFLIIAFFAKSLSIIIESVEPAYERGQSVSVYRDEQGVLRYAQGACSADSDCAPTGCSEEICASEPTLSTCEVKFDAPDATLYRCGCYNYLCAWILR